MKTEDMAVKKKNYAQLKKFCMELGLDLFGVADITQIRNDFVLSNDTAEKFPLAVSIGAALSRAVMGDIADHPTRPYFHHYKTVNVFLDQSAYRIAQFIEKKGFAAFPVAASQILDWQKQTALLSHREIGRRAGLGWMGRNNLLVNKKLGSNFRLTTILTDMALPVDSPVKDTCGECRRCIAVCPAHAIKESPEEFDREACRAQLKEFQRLRYTEQFICGVCVRACVGSRRQIPADAL
jgi:epoxyqueuosine reductase